MAPKAPAAWAQIIDDYMLTLGAAGQPPTTTELRRIELVRMARDIGGRPADVAGEKFVEWFGAADRMDDRNAPQLPRRHPRILPVGIQNQAGSRPSGRRATQGTRATWATRAPRPGPDRL